MAPVRPLVDLTLVSGETVNVEVALLASLTVMVLPSTAVIMPLILLLSPSAAKTGSAARIDTIAAANTRCFLPFLKFISIPFELVRKSDAQQANFHLPRTVEAWHKLASTILTWINLAWAVTWGGGRAPPVGGSGERIPQDHRRRRGPGRCDTIASGQPTSSSSARR